MTLAAVGADVLRAGQVPFLDSPQTITYGAAYGLYAFLLKELQVRAGTVCRKRSQFMH